MVIQAEYGIFLYLAAVNLAGFFLMGLDKWKAKHKKWRIPEKTLFAAAVFGGSLGVWAGMYTSAIKPGIGILRQGYR